MIQVADNVEPTSQLVLLVVKPSLQEIITDVKDVSIKCMKVKRKKQVFISVLFVIQLLISENSVLKTKKTDQ